MVKVNPAEILPFVETIEGVLKLTLHDVPRQTADKYSVLFSSGHIKLRISEGKISSCAAKTKVIWEIEAKFYKGGSSCRY